MTAISTGWHDGSWTGWPNDLHAGGAVALRSARLAVIVGIPAVVLAALFWAWAGAGSSPAPYSPTSTAPDGAGALAEVLGRLGEHFEPPGTFPSPGRGVAVVLDDQLTPASRRQLLAWVRHGGVLVVADPSSPLEQASLAQGGPNQFLSVTTPLAPACSAPWVRGVSEVSTAGVALLQAPPGSEACFSAASACFALEVRMGHGAVVSLASATPWSNSELGSYGNARLAADLLAPVPGGDIAWETRPWVLGGSQSISSLIPAPADALMIALVVAAVATCIWRGRRLGRPVPEEPLVPVPGSELVLATGRLLASAHQPAAVAARLRSENTALLARALGLGPHSAPATVARVAAQRTGLAEPELLVALDGPLPGTDAELVQLTWLLQEARRRAAGVATTRT